MWNEKSCRRLHLALFRRLYRKQMDSGRYFLHEHPALATSWQERCVREVLALKGVGRVTADQCQFGQENQHGEPLRKPTGFMSNAPKLLRTVAPGGKGEDTESAWGARRDALPFFRVSYVWPYSKASGVNPSPTDG